MWLKWLPWRFIIGYISRKQGFGDPLHLLYRLSAFSKPAEVLVPGELLRAGAVMHARGLVNSQVIQHNLDWIWPYWVHRQFDPRSPSFIPRAFSISNINLTHRNWTAVGLPGFAETPIVDPRGLTMPFFDSWSIDAWIVGGDGGDLLPSRLSSASQRLDLHEGLTVETLAAAGGKRLATRVWVKSGAGEPVLRMSIEGLSPVPGTNMVVALRPCNPEGISFIHDIAMLPGGKELLINDRNHLQLSPAPGRWCFSCYRYGDVYHCLDRTHAAQGIGCDVGMATAAAVFPLKAGEHRMVYADVPLRPAAAEEASRPVRSKKNGIRLWTDRLAGSCRLALPDNQLRFLYESSLRTVLLHASGDTVYAGPYTYKRFWIRDAALTVHALLCAGLFDAAERVIATLLRAREPSGYFVSQHGEWDSNGQVLWALERFRRLSGRKPPDSWLPAVRRGWEWIRRKRLSTDADDQHAGLLPSGFSAEHFGPNDCYYWDDFWSIAGLRAAAVLLTELGCASESDACGREADDLARAVEHSLQKSPCGGEALPVSPTRRLDSAAVGSLVASYPLQLYDGTDPRIVRTAEHLLETCLIDGGLYHDIAHSGVNPYLTLHLAQALLRAGDPRAEGLIEAVAGLASPTGQWPEAIHPTLKSGCMGDGQHVWAAAEWLLMMRFCIVREEYARNRLVLFSGVRPERFPQGAEISFGPAPTDYGSLELSARFTGDGITVRWNPVWRDEEPGIDIALPGYHTITADPGSSIVRILPEWRQ